MHGNYECAPSDLRDPVVRHVHNIGEYLIVRKTVSKEVYYLPSGPVVLHLKRQHLTNVLGNDDLWLEQLGDWNNFQYEAILFFQRFRLGRSPLAPTWI